MDKPKKLILDYSKWRCGAEGDYSVGKGRTRLLNNEGYSCCLGQWSLQLGATEQEIIDKDEPNEIKQLIPLFCNEFHDSFEEYNEDTGNNDLVEYIEKKPNKLTTDCININDDKKTTSEEKIDKLRARLALEGIELEVINKP